jgi:glycerate kinase
MKVVIATDSFKGTMTSVEAGRAIRTGVWQLWPAADVTVVPMADGGEGTVQAVLAGAGGQARTVPVDDPLRRPTEATFGLLPDGRTAILEMASSSGLVLLRESERDPMRATSLGTGQQMRAALDAGATTLLLGVGGSGTVDGGAGCGQALGVQFRQADGSVLPPGLGGGDLDRVAGLDLSGRDPRLDGAEVIVLCDVVNPLCGPQGAAVVYGPQKGATPAQVRQLDCNLAHLAEVFARVLHADVRDLPGAGAAGGIGAGLVALADARLRSGVETVIELTRLADRIRGADLVITGEGRIDAQSLMGKVVSGVARQARAAGAAVVAIAGSAGPGSEQCTAILDAVYAVATAGEPSPSPGRQAMEALSRAAAHHLRAWSSRGVG